MSYQILSSKWRPQSFDQIIGQEHITQTLKNAISMDRLAHAFLFSGPRGVGKTTTARVLAATVNSVSNYSDCLDIIELDGASNRGIDEIREIRESVKFPPTSVKYKVYIIDEAHMLTEQAFNALLKTLEEPPSYIIFILATTDPQKMPQTILSRTQRYDFMRMSSHAIIDRLKFILSEEKIEYASDSLDLIAQKSDGSMRDALSMLDQIIAFSDNKITVKNIRSAIGLIDQEDIFELFEYVINQDADSAIKKYNLILETGVSSKVFIDDLCSFLNEIMLIKINPNNDKIFLSEELKNNIYSKTPFQMNDILRMLNISLRLSSAFKRIDNVKISIEVLIMKFISIIAQNSKYNQFSKSNLNIPKSDLKSNDNNELIKDNQNDREEDQVVQKEAVEPEILSHNSDEIPSKDTVNITNLDNNQKLDLSDIEKFDLLQQNWEDILCKIDETNSKLSSFLEETQIISLSDNVLHLEVNNGNSFIKKVIDTDQSIIKDIIKNICKLEVTISVKVNKTLDEKEEVSIENTKEENHPLLDDAINIFKGKIIS
tara:strand:- start:728 stop:2359 length:1632 start_codon:yes stop_codon:yes gene_type:complete